MSIHHHPSRRAHRTQHVLLVVADASRLARLLSSSFAAAAYLEQTEFKKTGKKVYIIGEVGIEEELDLIGVPYIGAGKDSDKEPNMKPGALPASH